MILLEWLFTLVLYTLYSTWTQFILYVCVCVISKPQQYKMARYCEEIFGDFLLKLPVENFPVNTLISINSNFMMMDYWRMTMTYI